MGDPVKIDLQGQEFTREHAVALSKLCPGAEWSSNGQELLWYSTDKPAPAIEDITAMIPIALKEEQDELTKDGLIRDKMRQIAIEALKIEGKLDANEKLIAQEEIKG